MIPKIIHFCWFGPHKKSEIAQRCIESWRKFCPGFEIKEWTESNTKPYQNKFFKDALRKKKYAFVSDCVRVQAMYEYGGIYLDTDMLLLNPITQNLLKLDFFTGYEVEGRAAYGFFGAIPKHRFIEKMVHFYGSNEFNEFSLPVITHQFKDVINSNTIYLNEKIFKSEVFYPLSFQDRHKDYKEFVSEATLAVHLWDHSWDGGKAKQQNHLIKYLFTVLTDFLFHSYSKEYFIRYFRGFSRQLYHQIIGKTKK
jgi:mannosyltransferase OCH1-like enzyme